MGTISKKAKTSAGKLFGVNRIYGAEGDHETIYMTRLWFGRLRLHFFHRGDADPDSHDHPWGFWTFPLRSYVEEVLEERIETRWEPDPQVLAGYDEDGDPIWLNHYTMNGGREKFVRPHFERRLQVVQAFRLHFRPATHRHRVLGAFTGMDGTQWGFSAFPRYAPVGLIPTIVWRTGVERAWGFTKERAGFWCWTPWKTYVFEGGKDAPCGEE